MGQCCSTKKGRKKTHYSHVTRAEAWRYTDDRLMKEMQQPTDYISPAELAVVKTDALLVRDAFAVSRREAEDDAWVDQEMMGAADSGNHSSAFNDDIDDAEEHELAEIQRLMPSEDLAESSLT